jgi:hypothetical protein
MSIKLDIASTNIKKENVVINTKGSAVTRRTTELLIVGSPLTKTETEISFSDSTALKNSGDILISSAVNPK